MSDATKHTHDQDTTRPAGETAEVSPVPHSGNLGLEQPVKEFDNTSLGEAVKMKLIETPEHPGRLIEITEPDQVPRPESQKHHKWLVGLAGASLAVTSFLGLKAISDDGVSGQERQPVPTAEATPKNIPSYWTPELEERFPHEYLALGDDPFTIMSNLFGLRTIAICNADVELLERGYYRSTTSTGYQKDAQYIRENPDLTCTVQDSVAGVSNVERRGQNNMGLDFILVNVEGSFVDYHAEIERDAVDEPWKVVSILSPKEIQPAQS